MQVTELPLHWRKFGSWQTRDIIPKHTKLFDNVLKRKQVKCARYYSQQRCRVTQPKDMKWPLTQQNDVIKQWETKLQAIFPCWKWIKASSHSQPINMLWHFNFIPTDWEAVWSNYSQVETNKWGWKYSLQCRTTINGYVSKMLHIVSSLTSCKLSNIIKWFHCCHYFTGTVSININSPHNGFNVFTCWQKEVSKQCFIILTSVQIAS